MAMEVTDSNLKTLVSTGEAMELEELKGHVLVCLELLIANEAALIEQHASEWSIAHHLACYLSQRLSGWHVDCEHIRQGPACDVKRRTGGRPVRPDIVVHHRGRLDRDDNLLAIEVKIRPSVSDQRKVADYTAPPTSDRRFQYRYGVAVSLEGGPGTRWFSDGQEISS